MKEPKLYIIYVLLLVFATACDKNTTTDPQVTDKGKVLINNPWRLTSVTDANGKAIPSNQLNIETQAIYLFDIQFFDNNVTKALDRTSKQVVNGGTWYLIDDNQVLDIEVSQFKGKFPIKELSRSKMSLVNSVPVNGVTQEARLVFEPVIQ
ncbi:hypothetical protein [Salmonirosea aquatica]|uniref:Lipocalin-like domain-containing protein n=1 Tax=Salmonirosea aquatica TaxID=2654236 RepID=A0A7C9FQB2_9BACT|nr:hypothetical protein [Cytophagaceae bacterium SJW1-29]